MVTNLIIYFGTIQQLISMVTITPDAEKFIDELMEKNNKVGYGIRIYLSGFACSGPQFGMSFQQGAGENEKVDKTASSFEMYYDSETEEALKDCVIEFVDDPNFGTGLSIHNPNFSGCASCGGGCH